MTHCGYLDSDGRQCNGAAIGLQAMHLEPEIYYSIHDPEVPDTDVRTLATWVAVPLCKMHYDAFGGEHPTKVTRGHTK